MANVLKRLLGPANLANGTATIGTVTTSHTWTIKHFRIVNNSAGAITVKIGIGGVTDALLILSAISIAAGETYTEDCQITLDSAETLQANTTATGLTFMASGLDQS